MRLSAVAVGRIKALVGEAYGPDAAVRLFGSRVDDALKGGDIDLLVEVPALAGTPEEQLWRRLRLKARLEEAMDERRVDLIVADGAEAGQPAIVELARETGVLL